MQASTLDRSLQIIKCYVRLPVAPSGPRGWSGLVTYIQLESLFSSHWKRFSTLYPLSSWKDFLRAKVQGLAGSRDRFHPPLKVTWYRRRSSARCLVSVPDPTHYARKGLVTFEGFLGCAHPHVLIQLARDLHVRIHFVFTVSASREPVYVCVASLFSVLLINCQRSQISRSDQGRSDNGVYACANAYL